MSPTIAWIPNHAELQLTNSGSLSVDAPQGWIYSGLDTEGSLLTGEGCTLFRPSREPRSRPVLGLKTLGSRGSLLSCQADEDEAGMAAYLIGSSTDLVSGGFLDLYAQPYVMQTHESLPGPFPAMFQVPEVKLKIEHFLGDIYGSLSKLPKLSFSNHQALCPPGYLLAFVNIAGRAVLLPMPEGKLAANSAAGASACCHSTEIGLGLSEITISGVSSLVCCAASGQDTYTLSTSIALGGNQQVTSFVEAYTY